jgi:hypothetical protein
VRITARSTHKERYPRLQKVTVLHVIERIVAPLGLRVDESSPWVDARLSDGSRVQTHSSSAPLGPPARLGECWWSESDGAGIERPSPQGPFGPGLSPGSGGESGNRCRVGRAEPLAPEGGMAMATILVIAAVAACCALCGYGISRAVRRSRERRAQNA